MMRQKIETLAVKFGFKKAVIFGEEPPYPNPYGYETTPNGVPIVPRDEVKTGGFMGSKEVFGGGEIVSTGRHSFVNRTDMGATSVRKGQMFAFENQNPNRPALVHKVVDTGPKGISLETEDVGFLANSVNPDDFEEGVEVPQRLAAEQ